ncbi:MAG: hypothetical protein ACP5QV_05570 [Athalassotoga sp.]|uniref:hypothetical protein n=2 Tax=Athalassotoga sp. TaxID=2022597 RepID=UPI003CFD64BB
MAKYPVIFRTCLALLLSVLAVFIPFPPLKIIFGISALIIFAINVRRYFLIVIVAIVAISFAFVFPIRADISHFSYFNFFPISSQIIYPDMYIQRAKSLSVNVTGLDLTFDPSTDTVYIPSVLNVKRNGYILDISSNQDDVTFKIVVGTKDRFMNAHFHTTSLKVNGSISGENIIFDSTDIDMNSSISASKVSINGVGLNLNGTLNASNIEINGTGDNLDLMVSSKIVKINGVSINGTLKYFGEWTGERTLIVNAISGNLSVYTLSSNKGYLDIQNTGGFLKISRVRY